MVVRLGLTWHMIHGDILLLVDIFFIGSISYYLFGEGSCTWERGCTLVEPTRDYLDRCFHTCFMDLIDYSLWRIHVLAFLPLLARFEDTLENFEGTLPCHTCGSLRKLKPSCSTYFELVCYSSSGAIFSGRVLFMY
jgi:hypothetical protein